MGKNLRDQMPLTTSFVDRLREAFGREHIDAQIRRGIAGAGTFYARENGHEIGSLDAETQHSLKAGARYAADRMD